MFTGRADSQRSWGAAARAGAALLIVALGGCTSMSPVKTPANYIESVQPKLVRVTRADGTRFNMTGAHLQGDTLMGFVVHEGGAMGEFTEMPLGDVKSVEAQQYAHGKTALAIMAGIGAWAVVTYVYVSIIENSTSSK